MKKIIKDWDLGNHLVLVINTGTKDEKDLACEEAVGMKAFFVEGQFHLFDGNRERVYSCSEGFAENLFQGDILSVSNTGNAEVYYRHGTSEIDIFITNHCNSNCIMCPLSESFRRKNRASYFTWNREYINLLPDDIGYINVTGGEPTLMKAEFMEVMELLKRKFRWSGFQLLTNGRSLADRQFLKAILRSSPREMRFTIPLHASDPSLHDAITQTRGSFAQTDAGIRNLLAENQKVEVRIVLSGENIDKLYETARYVREHYAGAFCVTLVGMEMMGNAAVNRDDLWIDYDEIFRRARPAIDLLVESGFDVELFNFPLCAVDRGYWHIAAKSITKHKIRYMDECSSCTVKEICGGFFYSTKQIMNPKVVPIKGEYET